MTRIRATLHEGQSTFMLSRSIFLTIKSVSDRYCRENQIKHFMFSNPPPLPVVVPFVRKCGKMWLEPGRQATDDNIIQSMHIACWIPKATGTHSEYVILIVFPLTQMLHERASMLRYTYIACLV